MKYKTLLITSVFLLLLGLGFIIAGFHGDMSVNFGSSLASNAFHLCGDTTGGYAIIGILSILACVAMMVVTLIVLIKEKLGRTTN